MFGSDQGRIRTPRCINCGEEGSVIAPMDAIHRWMTFRPHVQDCFPTLSAELREQILTGIHPKCWNEMFPPEEDEVEEEWTPEMIESHDAWIEEGGLNG